MSSAYPARLRSPPGRAGVEVKSRAELGRLTEQEPSGGSHDNSKRRSSERLPVVTERLPLLLITVKRARGWGRQRRMSTSTRKMGRCELASSRLSAHLDDGRGRGDDDLGLRDDGGDGRVRPAGRVGEEGRGRRRRSSREDRSGDRADSCDTREGSAHGQQRVRHLPDCYTDRTTALTLTNGHSWRRRRERGKGGEVGGGGGRWVGTSSRDVSRRQALLIQSHTNRRRPQSATRNTDADPRPGHKIHHKLIFTGSSRHRTQRGADAHRPESRRVELQRTGTRPVHSPSFLRV